VVVGFGLEPVSSARSWATVSERVKSCSSRVVNYHGLGHRDLTGSFADAIAAERRYVGRTAEKAVTSDAFETFRRSMSIGYMEWHEGIGYDLAALAALPPVELLAAEDLLVARQAADWRDLEALDQIGSARALHELKNALSSKSVDIRIEAARRLAARTLLAEPTIETIIVNALTTTTILDGMVKTLAFAAEHPSPAVLRTLLNCSVNGNDDIRVHAAALVHFLYGGSSSSFDMKFRPFYLRFAAKNRQERASAYRELCDKIGVEPEGRPTGC
jgi:hypothetical protein